MSDEHDDRKPIKPPEKNHPDDRARVALEAAASAIPLGSAITKLVGEFAPTQAQRSRSKWEAVVSERTNENTSRIDDHDQMLAPKETLTGPVVDLAVALARAPGDGMAGKRHSLDDLCLLVPEIERQAVEDAAFELQSLGLIDVSHAIGGHWWIYLTQKFYEQVDHQVMGWESTTRADAQRLARLMLEDGARERTSTLHEASGWEKNVVSILRSQLC